jgi:nitric oxide reductase activation protein
MDAAMQAFEREAANIVTTGITRDNSFESLGTDLHTPLGSAYNTVTQKARDPVTGLPVNIRVERPRETYYQAKADRFKPATKSVARRLAIELDDIRSAVQARRDRFQEEGSFDRGRLVGMYKGDKNIRYTETRDDDTSLSASLIVDLSGSMSQAVHNGDLYQAVATISQAMTDLEMPHEIRAFSGDIADPRNLHLKAMDDPKMDDARVGLLADHVGGNDPMNDSAKLAATSLMGRDERNKLVLTLTDGEIVDFRSTRETLAAMRKHGVITFGVFYGDPRQSSWRDTESATIGESLDKLYGFTNKKRNWVAISDLSEFPKKVGKYIAAIFGELD